MQQKLRNNLTMLPFFAIVLISLATVSLAEIDEDQQSGQFYPEQHVVKGLDLNKYSGTWYEIAKYPSKFVPNGINTKATYTLRADGKLDVLNETFRRGVEIFFKGYAYKPDPKCDEAKFKVKFDNIPYFIEDYWVLYVDDDYQYAVVGHPLRFRLYILSRKNKIDDKVYDQLVQKAKEQGYNVRRLVKTPQTDTPSS